MKLFIDKIKVSAMTSVIPKVSYNFSDFTSSFSEAELQRIVQSTGISSTRVVSKHTDVLDLAFFAGKHLLQNISINKNDIDALILVTQTSKFRLPAASCILQDRLGLKTDIAAFDINYGCSGYIYGLYQAALLINTQQCKNVLVITADTISQYLNKDDHHVRMVFGDAASATLVQAGTDSFAFIIKTDGRGANDLKLPADGQDYLHMNGAKIMEFALREVPTIINEILLLKEWDKESLGCAALHQANKFMLQYLQKKMQLRADQVPIAVDGFGNTGPASIPLMLCLKADKLKSQKKLDKTVACGFGAGLSWGAAALNLSETQFIPLKEFGDS